MQTILGRSTGWPVGAEAYADLDCDGALSMALGPWPLEPDDGWCLYIYNYICLYTYDDWLWQLSIKKYKECQMTGCLFWIQTCRITCTRQLGEILDDRGYQSGSNTWAWCFLLKHILVCGWEGTLVAAVDAMLIFPFEKGWRSGLASFARNKFGWSEL